MITGWPHPDALPETSKLLNKKGYLSNFNKNSCGIKILYGVQEEGMGVEKEFVLVKLRNGEWAEPILQIYRS